MISFTAFIFFYISDAFIYMQQRTRGGSVLYLTPFFVVAFLYGIHFLYLSDDLIHTQQRATAGLTRPGLAMLSDTFNFSFSWTILYTRSRGQERIKALPNVLDCCSFIILHLFLNMSFRRLYVHAAADKRGLKLS